MKKIRVKLTKDQIMRLEPATEFVYRKHPGSSILAQVFPVRDDDCNGEMIVMVFSPEESLKLLELFEEIAAARKAAAEPQAAEDDLESPCVSCGHSKDAHIDDTYGGTETGVCLWRNGECLCNEFVPPFVEDEQEETA